MPKGTLTNALQNAIGESRMSLNALSKLSGVDRGQLCRFMAGERDFQLTTAEKLCKVLGLALKKEHRKLRKEDDQ